MTTQIHLGTAGLDHNQTGSRVRRPRRRAASLAGKSQPIAAYWEALGKVCPSCLTNPHPMGRALVARWRAEGDGFRLAFWLKDLEVGDG
jgi:hypothetical protein